MTPPPHSLSNTTDFTITPTPQAAHRRQRTAPHRTRTCPIAADTGGLIAPTISRRPSAAQAGEVGRGGQATPYSPLRPPRVTPTPPQAERVARPYDDGSSSFRVLWLIAIATGKQFPPSG